MHSVKYAIIQCAKEPFASDSIAMNVVLSSNTAYWDQFSGRTRFSSLPGKAKEKKKKIRRYPISVLSARRTQPEIRLVYTRRICRLWKCFSPSARDDFSGYLKTDIADNAPFSRRISFSSHWLSLADVLHAIIRREARSIPWEILD